MDKIVIIVTSVLALLSTLLGWRLSTVNRKLREAKDEAQDARKAIVVVTTHLEQEKAVAKQEQAKEKEIQEASDEEVIDIANTIIDNFNQL